jgi:hypothetical protein
MRGLTLKKKAGYEIAVLIGAAIVSKISTVPPAMGPIE